MKLENSLERQLWQIILDAHNYDEDTHLFLLEIRKIGPIRWALQRAVNVESDVLFMKYSQGVPIFNSTVTDATIVRRLLELLATGKESGPCLVPGDEQQTPENSCLYLNR